MSTIYHNKICRFALVQSGYLSTYHMQITKNALTKYQKAKSLTKRLSLTVYAEKCIYA